MADHAAALRTLCHDEVCAGMGHLTNQLTFRILTLLVKNSSIWLPSSEDTGVLAIPRRPASRPRAQIDNEPGGDHSTRCTIALKVTWRPGTTHQMLETVGCSSLSCAAIAASEPNDRAMQ